MLCPKCKLELGIIRQDINIKSIIGQIHSFNVPSFSCSACSEIYPDNNLNGSLKKLMAIDLLNRGIKTGIVLKYVREAFGHELDQAAKLLRITTVALTSIENDNLVDNKIWRRTSELIKIFPGEFDSIGILQQQQ